MKKNTIKRVLAWTLTLMLAAMLPLTALADGAQQPPEGMGEMGQGAAYFLRDGIHFLSFNDWRFFMDFIDGHKA